MASTSTNKQPLLVDSVLHVVANLDTSTTTTIDVSGTNTATLIVNAVSTDGAIIEAVYSIARGTSAEKINLYLSSATDYLRPTEGVLVGQFESATTVGAVTTWDLAPKILAPNAHTGDAAQLRALYVPKGKALWAARQSATVMTDGPLVGVQGGWY